MLHETFILSERYPDATLINAFMNLIQKFA